MFNFFGSRMPSTRAELRRLRRKNKKYWKKIEKTKRYTDFAKTGYLGKHKY